MFKNLDKYRDLGIFILRLGLGAMFLYHGWPKISGGVETWRGLGMAMGSIGMYSYPEFWGFMAAISEFGGAVLLITGFLMRPAALLMAFTMFVAAMMHLKNPEQGLKAASHAIESGVAFLSLVLIGPGDYAISGKSASHKDKPNKKK